MVTQEIRLYLSVNMEKLYWLSIKDYKVLQPKKKEYLRKVLQYEYTIDLQPVATGYHWWLRGCIFIALKSHNDENSRRKILRDVIE